MRSQEVGGEQVIFSSDYSLVFNGHIACPVRRGRSGESRIWIIIPLVCRLRHARFQVFLFIFQRSPRLIGAGYGILRSGLPSYISLCAVFEMFDSISERYGNIRN